MKPFIAIATLFSLLCGAASAQPAPLYYTSVQNDWIFDCYYDRTDTLVCSPTVPELVHATSLFTVANGVDATTLIANSYYSPVGRIPNVRTTIIDTVNPPTIWTVAAALLPSTTAPFTVLDDVNGNQTDASTGLPIQFDSQGDPLDANGAAYTQCLRDGTGGACVDESKLLDPNGNPQVLDPNGNPQTAFQYWCQQNVVVNPDGSTVTTYTGCRTAWNSGFNGSGLYQYQAPDVELVAQVTVDALGNPIVFSCPLTLHGTKKFPDCTWNGPLPVGAFAFVVNASSASGKGASQPGGSALLQAVHTPPPPAPPSPVCPPEGCDDRLAK